MTVQKLRPIIIVALTAHVALFFLAAFMGVWGVAVAMFLTAAVNVAAGVAVGVYAGQSRAASELIRAHGELATARAEVAAQTATNTDLREARDRALERAKDASQRAESHLASLREVEARIAEATP
ncbi:hypothetical protein AB0F88_39815 [Streptosporangium sp. NPDC023963]|uniref:hypothetical protein n=1 Tax=Streptosporangium sp. NPDC023963 TaxID=3155608 RepID=UPI003418C43D